MSLALGGQSAGGGEGYDVFATNNGAILTIGDGAYGIVMQTIGGGGGRGGGAAASNSGKIGLDIAVGASGGDGGDTYYNGSNSGVTNTGTILTYGADAGGILAQSIGGGGGAGGTAGTMLGTAASNDDGSNGSDENVEKTITTVAGDAHNVYNNIAALATTAASMLGYEIADGDIVQNLDDTAAAAGSVELGHVTTNNSLVVAVGGTGGAGGAGGDISVTNTGVVATMGNMSDAIVSQSIGGGGGKGGAATTASTQSWSDPGISSGVAIGGGTQGSSSNPNATNGGQAYIQNNGGTIIATGALAGGLIAQSIGMGGGIGGSTSITTTDSENNQVLAFPVSVGGTSEAANGVGQAAVVTSSGAIQTLGHDSYGIIAQSISGGGGIVKTLAANLDYAGGSAVTASAKDFLADISLGSEHGVISGISGAALATTTQGGTITTSGDNSFGILAQSVAGGGGLALGGTPTGTTALELFGSGGKTGSVNPGLSNDPDDNSGVIVEVGDNINTSGDGSVGVFAQSVGGGGGISGNIGASRSYGQATPDHSSFVGDGGDAQVTVDAGATITTTGMAAAGIIAQSVGGGGGWVATQDGAYIGSAGGSGDGLAVIVTVNGAVDARGGASAGIFAQSAGGDSNGTGGSGTGNAVIINIGSATNTTASVMGGNAFGDIAAAIYIAEGTSSDPNAPVPSQLTNYGTIGTHDTTAGTAVYSAAGAFAGTNYGTITGNIHLATGDITNQGSGTIHTYSDVDLGGGTLDSAGTLIVGALDTRTETTLLTGDYLQRVTGALMVNTDHANSVADWLHVTGTASLAGTVKIDPLTLTPATVRVLSADGGLTVDDGTVVSPTHIFSYAHQLVGGSHFDITPSADFHAADDGLNREQQELAQHLQSIWDSPEPEAFGHGFAGLADIPDAESYVASLNSLIDRTLNAIGTARYASSRTFVNNMRSCPVFVGASLLLEERDCSWLGVTGSTLDRASSSATLGFDAGSFMLQAGGQRAIAPDVFLAGSLAYEEASLTGDAGTFDATGNAFFGSLGLKRQDGPLQVNAFVDASFGSYDTRRAIRLGPNTLFAAGTPISNSYGFHGRISYEVPFESFYVRPFLDLDAMHLDMPGYTETGAGDYNLAVSGTQAWILTAMPAIEFGTRMALQDGTVLRPYAALGASFAHGNDWTIDARFATAPDGTGGFSTRVDNPGMATRLSLGLDAVTVGDLDVRLRYDADLGSEFFSHAGSLKLVRRF